MSDRPIENSDEPQAPFRAPKTISLPRPKNPDAPKPPSDMALGVAAQRILEGAVHIGTGDPDLSPRPGQNMMLSDVVEAMKDPDNAGQALGEGPTGVGKSFVYLSAAAAAVATRGERSVVSTESLALQAQIVDKDAPIVARASKRATGYEPKVAVLKGFANYACSQATHGAANTLVESLGGKGDGDLATLKTKLSKVVARRGRSLMPEVREQADLISWSLEQCVGAGDERVTGDKNAYSGNLSNPMAWDSVSVSSSDCLGADRCPFAEQCLPRAARDRAAEADIVVTNHHLLAVQAANDIPVVIGSRKIGNFNHVFVDEAHGLPQIVRSQGSVEVSSRAIRGVARAVERVVADDGAAEVRHFVDAAESMSMYIDTDLQNKARRIPSKEKVLRLGDGESPFDGAEEGLLRWLDNGSNILKRANAANSDPTMEIGLKRAAGRIAGLKNAIELVGEHRIGTARWVEVVQPHPKASDQRPYPVARYTPVDVAPMIRYSLWSRDMTDEEREWSGHADPGTPVPVPGGLPGETQVAEGPTPRVSLTAVTLSATMPNGFGRQVGIKSTLRKYPSPFDSAYGSSMLFVPRAVDEADVAALGSNRYGKTKFDTNLHADWAAQHMMRLVEANGGSALILAATAANGRKYAQYLSTAAKGRWKVLSQWDGVALRKQVEVWKSDTTAVLIGTKSLMTGVDAGGDTCTLVIIDRPARAASNPVDDARVEQIVTNAEMDKWAADRLVYVADAGLLLEQGSGRLIRKITDSGMVAVLDPRLLKVGPFAYQAPTRKSYLDTLHRFGTNKMSDLEAAEKWLLARREKTS